jgi:hypothetical protein
MAPDIHDRLERRERGEEDRCPVEQHDAEHAEDDGDTYRSPSLPANGDEHAANRHGVDRQRLGPPRRVCRESWEGMDRTLPQRDLFDGLFDVLWKLNWKEPLSRVEVIFARFVDYSNQVVWHRVFIFEDFIDLAKLERAFVVVVPDAHGEMLFVAL